MEVGSFPGYSLNAGTLFWNIKEFISGDIGSFNPAGLSARNSSSAYVT